ncbi:MAG: nucleotide exchange factor GrpE [Candidatus Thermoplasmatota archaeon]|nr:nucleotide exchange factor GrpE [Candidatus Thermoplasmatota archaeon]
MPTKKTTETKKRTQDTLQIKIKELEDTLQQLRQELKEKNDKYLRALADYQNYEKRMEKELSCREEQLKKKYLTELLDFQELLKQAYADTSPKEGLKLLIQNFDKFFEKEGITYIECKGKPFDHTLHHALSVIEKDECTDGEIVEEVKKGYMLGEKLLRPSQVIVVKKKDETP